MRQWYAIGELHVDIPKQEKAAKHSCFAAVIVVIVATVVGIFIADIKNVSALMDTHTGRSDRNRTCAILVPNRFGGLVFVDFQ